MDLKDNDYLQGGVPSDARSQDPTPGVVEPPRSLPPYPPYPPTAERRRRFSGWRVLWGILFGLSVLANIGLFLLLLGAVVVLAGSGTGGYGTNVVREGPRHSRIAVIDIDGIIDGSQADAVHRQIKAAKDDSAVKGIIVRVNSPGGTISASDRIYREIADYRKRGNRPVVAFMQGMAASGGYYACVACEQIVAEPTAITGSIGVVMSHFVFQDLLENKLGIQPVFLTKGQKKDWPSSFRKPTDEELAYIDDRLLEPAYQRFISVVKEGRKYVLSEEDVLKLADGSIYVADQAQAVKLIDEIGYLDNAITMVKNQAGIKEAQVIEYRKPLSFMDLLMSQAKKTNVLSLDRSKLFELCTPQVLYLWNAY